MSEAEQTETGNEYPHRYNALMAQELEGKWQDHWEREETFHAPNPGEEGFDPARPKKFIMDMFPYPSGVGLHVGHPLGYIATDIYARYQRMQGCNVLHPMGYDAFGLPAEQYAIQTGQHPRITTEANIATMKAQMRRLGLGHDPRRSVATTDVPFYRWTQWIFLQIFNSWYDEELDRARPIAELIEELESGRIDPVDEESNPGGGKWQELNEQERAAIVNGRRMAYVAEIPVNWCPGLGTVLANEEVTAEGRSERGNMPVYKRPLRQWMLRITSYCERLLDDLADLDWPEPIKLMQRNWIGRSEGAEVDFLGIDPAGGESADAAGGWLEARVSSGWPGGSPPEELTIRVFTTRPDTLYGATYMVLAPEHPLVDRLTAGQYDDSVPESWRGQFPGRPAATASPAEMVAAYKDYADSKTDIERQMEEKEKTGVFIGAWAVNPVTAERVPIFIADYVLMGYGTGAIMAVPAHDTRDFEFATQFEVPIIEVVKAPSEAEIAEGEAFTGHGTAVNSGIIDGLATPAAKNKITGWLEENGLGSGTINYKLRDWLFSRQRYWGEPFPIIYDSEGAPIGLRDSDLPLELPEMEDYKPEVDEDPDSQPKPPLARAKDWATVSIDGNDYQRELNTMPNWAGSCWYYLRYLDPDNDERYAAEETEGYWMLSGKEGETRPASYDGETSRIGGVDLYVGGAEHAVLHLLYSRFWHKLLFDLGHVSTPEPFHKLFNQGYVQAAAFTDERGIYVEASEVEEKEGSFFHDGKPVNREFGKMGKSLKNAVTPDEICSDFGADTLRLYEMYMGPLEASKAWNTRDIIGSHRFLQRFWRNLVDEESGELRVSSEPADDELQKKLHKTIAGVRADMDALGFNTAIAKMIELNNALTGIDSIPVGTAENLVKMIAPFAPHLAEELWEKLGHSASIAYEPFPEVDASLLVEDQVEVAIQVMGKIRARLNVPAGLDAEGLEEFARQDPAVVEALKGLTVRKVIAVPDSLVNFVAN
jgi:leucyl-tRNA synthetase